MFYRNFVLKHTSRLQHEPGGPECRDHVDPGAAGPGLCVSVVKLSQQVSIKLDQQFVEKRAETAAALFSDLHPPEPGPVPEPTVRRH